MERVRATWEYGQRPVILLPVSRQPEVVLWRENCAIWTNIRYESQIGTPRGQIYRLYLWIGVEPFGRLADVRH